jgi:hypothetical protein
MFGSRVCPTPTALVHAARRRRAGTALALDVRVLRRAITSFQGTIVSLTPERFGLVAGGRINLSDQGLCNPSAATFCPSCTENSTTTTIA